MTILHGSFTDISREPLRGEVQINAVTTRKSSLGAGEIVTKQVYHAVLSGGEFTTTDIDPGPVEIMLRSGEVFERWNITVPETGTHELADLLDEVYEYTPEVVGEVQAAVRAASKAVSDAQGVATAFEENAAVIVSRAVQPHTIEIQGMVLQAKQHADKAGVEAVRAETAAGDARDAVGTANAAANRAEDAVAKVEQAAAEVKAEHTHKIADVEGLQEKLDSLDIKETDPAAHTHLVKDIDGLEDKLDTFVLKGDAPAAHKHELDEINGLHDLITGLLASTNYAIAPKLKTDDNGYIFAPENSDSYNITMLRDQRGLHVSVRGAKPGELYKGFAQNPAADLDRVASHFYGVKIPLTSTSPDIVNPYADVQVEDGHIEAIRIDAAASNGDGIIEGFFTLPIY